MISLYSWATKWGIPLAALEELKAEMGIHEGAKIHSLAGKSEAAVQAAIRLEASKAGALLWRNNVGGYRDNGGGFVRYGLANESKAMNKKVKSSDLVGIRPVMVTPDLVGRVIGQFIAREVKHGDWAYSGSEHEQAQLKFIEIVNSKGGDAQFANREGTI